MPRRLAANTSSHSCAGEQGVRASAEINCGDDGDARGCVAGVSRNRKASLGSGSSTNQRASGAWSCCNGWTRAERRSRGVRRTASKAARGLLIARAVLRDDVEQGPAAPRRRAAHGGVPGFGEVDALEGTQSQRGRARWSPPGGGSFRTGPNRTGWRLVLAAWAPLQGTPPNQFTRERRSLQAGGPAPLARARHVP